MSDIKVGDLVMLVKTHCGGDLHGEIATVTSLDRAICNCSYCKTTLGMADVATTDGSFCAPLSWLKKIPPLGELEDEKREEELTA